MYVKETQRVRKDAQVVVVAVAEEALCYCVEAGTCGAQHDVYRVFHEMWTILRLVIHCRVLPLKKVSELAYA